VENDGVGNAFQYDGENRQTRHSNSQGTTDYVYDGDGHRLMKIGSSATTLFVYNVGDQLVAEYTTAEPLGGGISYLTTDHLGSTRLVTKGDATQSVLARYDYLPFGGEIAAGTGTRTTGVGYSPSPDKTRQKFTQKERDAESGLDYVLARYYSSPHGCFSSVDPMLASGQQAEPQSWNRFSYVQNNPLRYIDPNGERRVNAGDRLANTYEAKKNPDGSPLTTTVRSNLVRFRVEVGTLTTRDGTKIEALKNIDSDIRLNTQCHGLTFTNGKVAIDNKQVDKLLTGEGFKLIEGRTKPKVGDVAIYRNAAGEAVHSATVSEVDKNGNVTKVTGLGGLEIKAHSNPPNEHYQSTRDPVVKIEYHRRNRDNRRAAQRREDVDRIQNYEKRPN
jgi:RHS repeat-associated protein